MTGNKTALIVGGSGGIGMKVIEDFLSAGYNVISTYYSNPAGDKFKDSTKYREYELDLLNHEEVENVMSDVVENNNIDIVVYLPTLKIKNSSVFKTSYDEMEKHWKVQAAGFFNIVKLLGKQIKEKRKIKFIVVLTEYCMGKPPAGIMPYISAKYALMGMAKAMAVEISRYGSTVNMVSPGMVQTGLIEKLPPKLIEMTADTNPLKRIAKPEDVSSAIMFLADDKSNYLNGVNITVNGGNMMF